MSERIRSSAEQNEVLRDKDFFEEHRRDLEKARERMGREPNHQESSIENILDTIEKNAVETEKLFDKQEAAERRSEETAMPISSSLGKIGYRQTMKRVQRKLPANQRRFSKVIHNPVVETASDVAGGTIARPSGLLAGGITSLIVNLLVIIVCRYYGYEYNYLLGILGFLGGFVLGVTAEFAYRAIRPKKAR